MGNSL
jgi:hypothetical protein